jgi:hypothetical protein
VTCIAIAMCYTYTSVHDVPAIGFQLLKRKLHCGRGSLKLRSSIAQEAGV